MTLFWSPSQAALTSLAFGPGGLGLTHSVLHDQAGPLGSLAQTLTVRV